RPSPLRSSCGSTGPTTPSSRACPTSSPWSSWPSSTAGSAPPRPSARPTKPARRSDGTSLPAGGRSGRAPEGVALGGVAGAVAGGEPALALLGRAVGPGLGVGLALEPFLDAVVADGGGGVGGGGGGLPRGPPDPGAAARG